MPTLANVPPDALSALPPRLRKELLAAFAEIVRNFAESRWEPAELNGGKLCEVAYSVVNGIANGSFPDRAAKPKNMAEACKALEQLPAARAPRSVRVQIPRMLVALYEIRNNRNVGHIGGDVDPNHMDAMCVLYVSKWIMAELIRLLHKLPIEDAGALVDAMVERETPLIWEVGGVKRILRTDLPRTHAVLLLLHSVAGEMAEADLFASLEISSKNQTEWRRAVIKPAHRSRLIEYDDARATLLISPLGIDEIERHVLRPHAAS